MLPEVQEICDRIGVVYEGVLRQVGTLEELRIGNVHRVDATIETHIAPQRIAGLAGVSDVTVTDHRVQCTITGGMAPLIAVLQPATILALRLGGDEPGRSLPVAVWPASAAVA